MHLCKDGYDLFCNIHINTYQSLSKCNEFQLNKILMILVGRSIHIRLISFPYARLSLSLLEFPTDI